MAYVDQNNSREKFASGILSVAAVGCIGYALVTGLAMNVIRTTIINIPLVKFQPDPPPPPEHKAQPKAEQKATPTTPPVTRDDRIPQLPPLPHDGLDLFPTKTGPLIDPVQTRIERAKPSLGVDVRPLGRPGEWVTTDDYPSSALRDGQQGRTSFRLDIGSDGRVTGCTVTQTSGSDALDSTACRMLQRRAKFTAARDADGNAIASSYSSGVLWKMPAD